MVPVPVESGKTQSLEYAEQLARTVLDSISAHIAVLDASGNILETNRAWRLYADDNRLGVEPIAWGPTTSRCARRPTGDDAADAKNVARGLRAVISGKVDEFLYDYPCHSPDGKHWFYMRAVRMTGVAPIRVVVSHENITDLKLAEEALRESREKLNEKKQGLEEANIALKVLLKQRENDKVELERTLLTNIRRLVLPYLGRLKKARLKPKEQVLVEIVDTHLNDIISPLLQRLSATHILLTPQEIQVAALVRDGRTSKEIADVLFVSETTVHFHRKNLRKKLGLRNRRTNLRTHLMTLA